MIPQTVLMVMKDNSKDFFFDAGFCFESKYLGPTILWNLYKLMYL